MEAYLTGFNFSVFNISLISDQTYRNIRTNFGKVLIPFVNISIGISRGKIKHNDTTIGINIVALSKLSKFLLSSCVPNIKGNLSDIGVKDNVGNLGTFGWDVWFLEVTGVMSLGKGGLTNATISNKD